MNLHPRVRRLIGLSSRFLTVGAISTIIEIASFNVLIYALHVDEVWAKVIASLIALINAYFGNREWTFKRRGSHTRLIELVLFLIVNGACTLLGAGVIAVGLWSAPDAGPFLVNAINVISIGIVVAVRFLAYHYIVFRGVRPSETAPGDIDYRPSKAGHDN